MCVGVLVAQLSPTLCHPMDYILPGSSVHGDSPGKNTGVGCHALLLQEATVGLSGGLISILFCLAEEGGLRRGRDGEWLVNGAVKTQIFINYPILYGCGSQCPPR